MRAPTTKKGNTRKNRSIRKRAKTKHTQTTTSPMAAQTQVCYMPCNAKSRRQVKHDDNRTGKENQQEVSPTERLCPPPHTKGTKGIPVHACPYRRKVCPYRRKQNKATTATGAQNGMKGQNGGTQNKQREEERTEEATHNRGEAQHTQKQETKTKHTQHAQAATTAPAAETQVQVCYMPRHPTQRTRDKNDNHANKGDHEV